MGHSRPFSQSRPLQIEEVDLAPPGPREVLVEVKAAGLCHSDLSVIDGSRPRPMPMVLGHETAGIVREVGAAVVGFEIGDHVVLSFLPSCGRCAHCASGRPVMCPNGAKSNTRGELLSGGTRFQTAYGTLHHHLGVSGFAQFAVVAQESLVKVDTDLPFEIVALFGCAVLTGVGAVFNTAAVRPGMSVAVFGMGGVGLSAVMGARCAGATKIVAVDVVPHKLQLAEEVGATHLVNATNPEIAATIRAMTDGGADVVIEAVGNAKVLTEAYAATARGGTTVAVGLPDPSQSVALNAVSIVAEERTVKGSYMGSCVPRRDIPRYIELYRRGLLPVARLHSGTIALDQINEGFDALANGEAVRQIVAI